MAPTAGKSNPQSGHRKRRVTLTPAFTPMSVGVRETEWLQLTQLGLGKALDATNPHPWASKSSYQAKEVQVCDLVLTDEGQRLKNYVEVIDNYFNVQGSLEGSIRLPHQPIEMGVAADTHRSYTQTQEIRGKTVYTRTVAFTITPDYSQECDTETLFQYQLKCYLERECEKIRDKERNGASDVSLCLDFLHSLGGVTHYISSITLGAMEYSVKRLQALEIGTTAHSRVGFGPLAGIVASQTVMVEKSKRKQVQHSEKIGRISDTDHVSPHTHDEAVIHYSITSLGNLITDRRLRECVQRAIQSYIATRLHRINGPFYIMTPERELGDRNIYWQMVEVRERGMVTHFIRHNTNKEDASTFYIRPDYRKVGKYFFITTFDAEPRTTSVKHHSSCETSGRISTSTLQAVSTCPDTSASDKANEGNVLHDHSDSGHVISGNYGNQHHSNESLDHHGDVHVHAPHSAVERYVHISTSSLFKHFPGSTRIKLKAKSAVRPDFARFQLIDRRDRKAKTLLESDWLPDERESQGQPFFLRQYYHLSKCIGITGFAESQATRSDYRFNLSKKSSHCEGRCHMLFQLVRAEKMTDSNAGNLD